MQEALGLVFPKVLINLFELLDQSLIHTSKAYTSNCIKINDEMSSFAKQVLESANMTREVADNCLESDHLFRVQDEV